MRLNIKIKLIMMRVPTRTHTYTYERTPSHSHTHRPIHTIFMIHVHVWTHSHINIIFLFISHLTYFVVSLLSNRTLYEGLIYAIQFILLQYHRRNCPIRIVSLIHKIYFKFKFHFISITY